LEERVKEPVKVLDRRLFTREGERREVPEGERSVPPPPEPAPAEPAERPQGEPQTSPLFEGLVAFLADSAMMGMQAGAPASNFSIFIDFLELLKEKTRGNLSADESALLQNTLGEMKLVYLRLAQRGGGKKP
jgi:hypothetical protein